MQIKLIKEVVFRDQTGAVTRTYRVGDVIDASAKDDEREYFVHSYGGIFYSEAVELPTHE